METIPRVSHSQFEPKITSLSHYITPPSSSNSTKGLFIACLAYSDSWVFWRVGIRQED